MAVIVESLCNGTPKRSIGGSHIDMLHESPLGMGIAHDSGNSYWYFDGYYGHLVYYDFKEDHDIGMDDHSDGVVRRYLRHSAIKNSGHTEPYDIR